MDYIRINEKDNVCVALKDLKKGTTIEVGGKQIVLLEDIARGHKVSICDLKEGDNIIKYSFPIGHATADIPAGSHVHVHNIKTNLGDLLEYS